MSSLMAIEHDAETGVIALLQRGELPRQILVRVQHLPQTHEGPHDLDVPHELEVTICDLKFACSSGVSRNMKSSGKRSMFRFTAWFSTFTSTP